MNSRLEEDREYARELDQKTRSKYPDHADEARKMINTLLHRFDKHRWLVFNREIADKNMDLGDMGIAHSLIADLLQCRDEGQPVTDLYLEKSCRVYLHLPFYVIQGGKQD